tara:strand:- start:41 stop:247 length:207 start_codon:yes stop_codon:yes gene_type:complete
MTSQVIVNGKQTEIQLPCTLEFFLTRLKLPSKSVIVELNGQPTSPSQFTTLELFPDDRLEIVTIVAGG